VSEALRSFSGQHKRVHRLLTARILASHIQRGQAWHAQAPASRAKLCCGACHPCRFWSLHELSSAEIAVFFAHFADLGYGVVSRDDNIEWGLHCCAEFTLVKVEKPAGC
jgi:hypothetical protein